MVTGDVVVPLRVVFDPVAGSVTLTNPAGQTILRAPAFDRGHATAVMYDLGYQQTGEWEYEFSGPRWVTTGAAIPPINYQGRD